jgi:GLPGLI family protein
MKLLPITLSIALAFTMLNMNAQNFNGTATYQSKTNMKGSVHFGGMDEATQKMLDEKMNKAFEKEYTLRFDKTTSLYVENAKEKLNVGNNSGIMTLNSFGDDGKLYKDIKAGIYVNETEMMDKPFLIEDQLTKWDWQITTETKEIGGYLCQKATATIQVTAQEIEDYKNNLEEMKKHKTAFIMDNGAPKAKTHTAWFALEIPVNQGPGNYWGLPGLILEVSEGKTNLLCSKIVLNSKDPIVITKPTKGKKVNQKQYEKIEEDKLNSMKDRNGVINISVGG